MLESRRARKRHFDYGLSPEARAIEEFSRRWLARWLRATMMRADYARCLALLGAANNYFATSLQI